MGKFDFANLQLDLFIIIMLAIFAVYLRSAERYKRQLNKYLLYFILANIAFMISDLGDWIFRIITPPVLSWQVMMLTVTSVSYYIATGLVQFTFGIYFFAYVGVEEKIKKRLLVLLGLWCCTEALLSVISPFAPGIFYIDRNGYHRGELFLVALFVPLLCGVIATYVLVRYRKKLTRREIVFYSSFFILPIVGNIMQIIIPGTAIVNISLFTSIFLIMINIQFEYELKLNKQLQKSAEIKLEQAKKSIQMANETILTIANAVDAKDIKTSKHSYRVAEYSVLIARQLRFTKEQLKNGRGTQFDPNILDIFLKLIDDKVIDIQKIYENAHE